VTGEFMKRTRTMRDGMKDRFGSVMLPFSLEALRVWLLQQFGAEDKAKRCPYCQRVFITVFTCVIDHADPASRGGSLDLTNLKPCCRNCNDIKGALGAMAFIGLMRYLDSIDPRDAQEIRRRLEICYKLAASNAIRKRREEQKWGAR
jgi:hypothetical protein